MRFLTLVGASLAAISLAAALPLGNTGLHRRTDRNANVDRSAAELQAEEDLRRAILESSKVVKTKAKGKRPVPKKKPSRNSFGTPKPVKPIVDIRQTAVVKPTAAEIEAIEARKAAFKSRVQSNGQAYTTWQEKLRMFPESYPSIGPYEMEAAQLYKQTNDKVWEYTEAHFGDVDYMERAMAILNNPDFGGNVELERIYRLYFLPKWRSLVFPDLANFPWAVTIYADQRPYIVNEPVEVNANPDPQAEIESVLPGEFPAENINPHATIEVPQMEQAEIEAADVAESVEKQLGNLISHL